MNIFSSKIGRNKTKLVHNVTLAAMYVIMHNMQQETILFCILTQYTAVQPMKATIKNITNTREKIQVYAWQ